MNTGVTITLIICATLIILSAINAVKEANKAKKSAKMIDETFLKFFKEREDK